MIRIVKVLTGAKAESYRIEKASKSGWKGVFSSDSLEECKKEYINLINPIKDNRLVDGITFALRFQSFLEGIQVCDACGEDELDYMKYVANALLELQKATVEPNSEEERYLQNNGVLPR